LLSIATAHHTSGDLRELNRVATESFGILRHDPRAGCTVYAPAPYAHMLMHQGRVFHYMGRLAASEQAYDHPRAEARVLEATDQIGWITRERSWLEVFRGDAAAALEHATCAMEIAQQTGNAFSRSYANRGIALAHAAGKRWHEAAELLERGAVAIRGTGY